jgi:hypothetical protein
VEDERAGIVAGTASVPTFDIPDSEDKDEGIPEFWLTAMSNHDAIGGLISDRDADVLAYLRDIRWGCCACTVASITDWLCSPWLEAVRHSWRHISMC